MIMTNLAFPSKWSGLKKLWLALPLVAVIAASVPNAQADDHHRERRDREYRREYRHGDRDDRHGRGDYRRHHRGYYHEGRYYSGRRYYYRDGRRYYRYYGLIPGGVSVNIGL